MNRRTLLITVLVALLVSLSNWLMERAKVPGLTPTAPSAELPDYFLSDFTAIETDERGQLSQQVEANYMVHLPERNESRLDQPRFMLYRERKVAWRAQSREGVIIGQDEVQLSGDVVLRQPQAATPVQLNTQSLRLFPARRYAETDQPVVLLRSGSRIDGTGIELYGDEERLVLLSQVRGRHEKLAY